MLQYNRFAFEKNVIFYQNSIIFYLMKGAIVKIRKLCTALHVSISNAAFSPFNMPLTEFLFLLITLPPTICKFSGIVMWCPTLDFYEIMQYIIGK